MADDFNRDGKTDFSVSTKGTVKIMANDGMGGFEGIQAVKMPINPLAFSPFTFEFDAIKPGALMVTELLVPLSDGDPVQFLNVFSRPADTKVLPDTESVFA